MAGRSASNMRTGFLRGLFRRRGRKGAPDAEKHHQLVQEWEAQDFAPPAKEDAPVVDPWDADAPAQERTESAAEPPAEGAGAVAVKVDDQAAPGTEPYRSDAPATDVEARGEEPLTVEDEAEAAAEWPEGAAAEGGAEEADGHPDPWEVPVDDGVSDTVADEAKAEPRTSQGSTVDVAETTPAGVAPSEDTPEETCPGPEASSPVAASEQPSETDIAASAPAAVEPEKGPLHAHGQEAGSENVELVGSEAIGDDVWEELSAAEADGGETALEDDFGIEEAVSSVGDTDDDTASEAGNFDGNTFDFDVVDPVAADEDVDIDADVGASDQTDPWAEDLGAAFEPFDFDPDAYQSPWEGLGDGDLEDITPQDKAARIAAELDVVKPAAQRQVARELTELFQRLPHPATFRALATAADNGLTPGLLRDMVALREVWAQRPEFWLRRSVRTGDVYKNHSGAAAMTWALARRVCLARDAYPPEDMVDPEWVREWLLLERGEPGYLDFAHFVDLKISNLDSDLLDQGFNVGYQDLSQSHIADNWDWIFRNKGMDHYHLRFDPFSSDLVDALRDLPQAKEPARRELLGVQLDPELKHDRTHVRPKCRRSSLS